MRKFIAGLVLAVFSTIAMAQAGQRNLRIGETVILSDQYHTVMRISPSGSLDLKNNLGVTARSIPRAQVAVTSGCLEGLCVNERVIALATGRLVRVLGISYQNRLITNSVDGWHTMSPNLRREDLAVTRGCHDYTPQAKICTGNIVRGPLNKFYKVIGLQTNGNVVLLADDNGAQDIRKNISPSTLVIVR